MCKHPNVGTKTSWERQQKAKKKIWAQLLDAFALHRWVLCVCWWCLCWVGEKRTLRTCAHIIWYTFQLDCCFFTLSLDVVVSRQHCAYSVSMMLKNNDDENEWKSHDSTEPRSHISWQTVCCANSEYIVGGIYSYHKIKWTWIMLNYARWFNCDT